MTRSRGTKQLLPFGTVPFLLWKKFILVSRRLKHVVPYTVHEMSGSFLNSGSLLRQPVEYVFLPKDWLAKLGTVDLLTSQQISCTATSLSLVEIQFWVCQTCCLMFAEYPRSSKEPKVAVRLCFDKTFGDKGSIRWKHIVRWEHSS